MPAVTLGSNLAALSAERRLGESTAGLRRTFDRLASGLRINRAADDAAGLSVAASLNADARVYGQALKNINDGVSYLSVAAGAAGELKSLLFRMRELSTQSSNGVYSDAQRAPLDEEVRALVGEYNRIVAATAFNGQPIFAPENATLVVQAGFGLAERLSVALGYSNSSVSSDGTFKTPSLLTVGGGPRGVVAADFNGDGNADVAGSYGPHWIAVALGNGDGTFQAPADYMASGAGSAPRGVIAADFNGDGSIDLATANEGTADVSILLGNGDGTFQASQDHDAGDSAWGIAVADFNGDGDLDIVTRNYSVADPGSVLLGNGDGTFQPRQSLALPDAGVAVTTGDFNRDGKADIASADFAASTVTVLLGNGDGTFQAGVQYGNSSYPRGIISADVNGDGKLDLITANVVSDSIGVYLGVGDGTFLAESLTPGGDSPYAVAAADLNGDGKLDLVSADNGSDELSVLIGNGDGTFQPRQVLAGVTSPYAVTVADFSGEGAPDLAATNEGDDSISVYLANATVRSTNVTIRPIAGVSVASLPGARSAQDAIDGYLDEVNAVVALVGAAVSRFEAAGRLVQDRAAGLREAEGRIRDADVAEDASTMVRGQILQQAASAVLTSANQQPRFVLGLLP